MGEASKYTQCDMSLFEMLWNNRSCIGTPFFASFRVLFGACYVILNHASFLQFF